jgi:hypothetical protein
MTIVVRKNNKYLRYEVLTRVAIKVNVFSGVTPYNLVGRYHSLERSAFISRVVKYLFCPEDESKPFLGNVRDDTPGYMVPHRRGH